MVQGRISFSRLSSGDRAFLPGRNPTYEEFERNQAPSHDGESADGAKSARIPEIADDWIMHGIGRRRARALHISALQRERIEEFVAVLMGEESDRCEEMLWEALTESKDPQKVVEILLEPAARIVGENWCADECDFLKVTIAVSRMQRLFRRMTSEYPATAVPDLSRCALLAPAPGEQHTFGLAVVDDAFRRAGWEVDCCGCDEEADMLRLAASNHYQIVGVSVSVERRLADLAEICRKLRSWSRNKSIVLIAGGSMVIQNPQGAIGAGFDLLAVDAVSAVALADTVVASLKADNDRRMAAE
jgi:methanogenic corrinoid protein MtbC1